MVEGIILAGGFSSRALSNKMLFSYQGKPLIWYAIEGMKPFVDHIIIVTGHYDKEIREAIGYHDGIEYVYNEDYEKGMFSSVRLGVMHTCGDFFILPGDCPFVEAETYKALLEGSKSIRIPRFNGKDGHPLFMEKGKRQELLEEPLSSNLKLFRDKNDYKIININDSNVLIDIDTKEEYTKIIEERK